MRIYLGDNVLIPLQLSFGETNQYPQVLIYDSAGTLLSTNDMTHKATGFYYYDWTPVSADYYTLIFKVYTDAGHSVLSTTYGLLSDSAEVINNLETKVDTIDGIVDAIKLKTDNLPSDPTSEINATANKDEIIASGGTAVADFNVGAD